MKAGEPSETAVRIAINQAAAASDPELRRVLADPEEPYSEWFVTEHSVKARQQLALWRSDKGKPILQALADGMEPGGPISILLRKRWIEDQVRLALREASQMVVLGAGYDPLALRLLDVFPWVSFVEVDHPATQAVKRRALEAHGGVPSRLALVPLDLAQLTLRETLAREPSWDGSLPTVFVAEGLLMFLADLEVDRVLSLVAERGESRLIFSFTDRKELLTRGSRVFKTAQMLKLSGEPIQWSLESEAIDGFLAERGLRLATLAGHQDLRRAYLAPLRIDRELGPGEWLVVAETR
ncbi:MAG TPA: class I SAM-dependent methyltransferase [Vicinamibacteria bacterium]|nr:class I SAM-dependent methyltransferase [Vicinamibacteria bacterium]